MAYALALRGTSNYSNAEKIYKDILDKEPENSEALLNYAILMVEYKKDKSEGLKILGKIKFFETNEEKMKLVKDLEERANQLK
jgi:thioredoxin-like negative regulator of GroEL